MAIKFPKEQRDHLRNHRRRECRFLIVAILLRWWHAKETIWCKPEIAV